jgi:hypothetical protein
LLRLGKLTFPMKQICPRTSFSLIGKNSAAVAGLLVAMAIFPLLCRAQQEAKDQAGDNGPVPIKKPDEVKFKQPSFTFVRAKYSGVRISGSWATDYPDSDLNFSARFKQITGLQTHSEGKIMALTDPELAKYPFVYIAEGGQMLLSPAEVKGLRDYLLGGGFLMVDDFWGEAEWKNCSTEIKRAFPDREPVELALDHPIFHCFYDIRQKPQVPNLRFALMNKGTEITWERPDAKEPHYRGLLDDKGRLMAILCHNTDLGDGWERAGEDAYYFKEFSLKKAYPMGINIVVYALTH